MPPKRPELPGTEPSYSAVEGPESSKTAPSGPERPPDVKSPAPRRLSSPDIQALARIDRILADLPPEVASRTVEFLSNKYIVVPMNARKEHL